MGKFGGFLKTVTLGGIVGFVAGLLFAPQKGDETRKKLQAVVEKGKEKINELKGCCQDDDSSCCCK